MSTVLLFYDIDVAYVNKRAFSPSANAAKMYVFLINLYTLLSFCVRQVEACLLADGREWVEGAKSEERTHYGFCQHFYYGHARVQYTLRVMN
jgi:hypothetical protein